MPRQKPEIEGRINVGQYGKIRKRGCSSSSSSSLKQRYRFKRAILIGKKGGSSTPVPEWRMGSRPPSSAAINAVTMKHPQCRAGAGASGCDGKELPVSARKLAATLWEINEVPSAPAMKDSEEIRNRKEKRRVEKTAKPSLPPHLSDPSHSPASERTDRSRSETHRRRASAISPKPQLADYHLGGLDSHGNSSLMEIKTLSRGSTPARCLVGVKSRLKDVSDGLTTSRELLKVLNRIWGVEEQHSSGLLLVSALRGELSRARAQVDQLIQEHHSSQNEINYLMKLFAEEKAAWKSKEQSRIHDAIASMAAELEVEKKLRRQTERLNKKLGMELADTKAALSKAVKELEGEKRVREILEQVCDELARGIGEDRAQVEELKRESERVREEVEKERQMLQLADVLREERVQMKLSEAKLQFEEKNAAVDRLKDELESYLRTKSGKENCNESPNFGMGKEFQEYGREISPALCENGKGEDNEGEVADDSDDDSADSDLHSIELNMDNNSKSYRWGYACGNDVQDDSQSSSVSIDKDIKGSMSSPEEKIQWGNISLGRETSDCVEWDFGAKSRENSDGLSVAWREDNEEEIKRNKSVKGLRDYILSGSKTASSLSFASPTRQWSQSLSSQGLGSAAAQEGSAVLHNNSLNARLMGIRDDPTYYSRQ
ncbi:uncharacterized protein At5g41620 [Malania oleifera]|uniref:uncharacterized protein At5g41620 n=1 Tax=Malania oleifera TaxID=397392 RepID=UPI0025AE3AA5|nr:uncharacterized protein At5g41620 [Malania oleifera]